MLKIVDSLKTEEKTKSTNDSESTAVRGHSVQGKLCRGLFRCPYSKTEVTVTAVLYC